MLYNRDKLELLNFGKSARSFHYETSQRNQIEAKQSGRDLGVIFKPNGHFDKHITGVVAKGNRIWMYDLDANFSKFSKLN